MATTTIRLDDDDRRVLDALAERHGGRSAAMRKGLRLLQAEDQRRAVLAELVAEWEVESGRFTEAELNAVAARYGW